MSAMDEALGYAQRHYAELLIETRDVAKVQELVDFAIAHRAEKHDAPQWSSEFPQQDGCYWLYGGMSWSSDRTIAPLLVWFSGNSFVNIGNSWDDAWDIKDILPGALWFPVLVPALPEGK